MTAEYIDADRVLTTARGFGYPTAREAALKLGYLIGEEFDALVKPEKMTRP